MPKVWLVTGISGSGRIEFLNELRDYANSQGKKVTVIDVGEKIRQKAIENNISFVADRILNLDRISLSLLRALAIQTIIQDISRDDTSEIIFIGMHALFYWRGKLIPGVSYSDLNSIKLDGVITVVDDVITICKNNINNPKYADGSLPSPESFQRWMMEEELLSDVFASIKGVPMFVLAKKHRIENLYSLFFGDKKRIYLSFPITAIRDRQDILNKIQNEYKNKLESLFFVFNPLDIMDKTHASQKNDEVAGFLEQGSLELIDSRTIERDYRFISQSDAVVVIYPTDKLSPGVSAEMSYAYSHQIPVFMLFSGHVSPFLDEIADVFHDEEPFFSKLEEFAKKDGSEVSV